MFCIIVPMFGRICVALYTLNLLGTTKPYLRYFLWALIILQVIMNLGIAITLMSVCGFDMVKIAEYVHTLALATFASRVLTYVTQCGYYLLQAITCISFHRICWR